MRTHSTHRRRMRAQIGLRFCIGAIDERVIELHGDFFADFETADANRRAEKCERIRRIEGGCALERVDRTRYDLLLRATPTGVDIRDDASGRMDHRDWQTIGNFDAESDTAAVAPQRVTR